MTRSFNRILAGDSTFDIAGVTQIHEMERLFVFLVLFLHGAVQTTIVGLFCHSVLGKDSPVCSKYVRKMVLFVGGMRERDSC